MTAAVASTPLSGRTSTALAHQTRSARHGASHRRAARRRRVLGLLVLAALAAGAVVAMVFAATGGRWFVVRTPSMGTDAPVGTLLLTRPTSVGDLHVGDVIAFHPATGPAATFTHRIVAIDGNAVTTRGDINGAVDPWSTTDRNIVGRVVTTMPGVGYLARALPLLLLGGGLVIALTHWWLRPGRRGPARLLAFTGLYLLAAVTIRPFVGVVKVVTETKEHSATVVAASTGLLPTRLQPVHGHGHARAVDIGYGQLGAVHFTDPPTSGAFSLQAHLHLSQPQWVIVGLISALPLLWVLLIGFRRDERQAAVPA